METKNKQSKSEVNLEELSGLSGEASVRQARYTVPIVKFNGNKGEFSFLTPKPEGGYDPQPLGNSIEGVILKIRRTFVAFEKTPTGSISFFTNEHNSFRDEVVLFERRERSAKPKMVGSGKIDGLRTLNPALRLKQYLYFLRPDGKEGQIIKLGVRGKSLVSLFEYYKDFSSKEHLFQFVTEITCHEEENEGGVKYFVMDFKKGKRTDMSKVEPRIREVAEALRAQDKSYAEMPTTEEEQAPSEAPKPEAPEKGVGFRTPEGEPPKPKDEEEIKVEDIPF